MLRLSRELKQAPPQIAAALAEEINAPGFSTAKQMGGYLNFDLNRAQVAQRTIENVLRGSYGASEIGKGKTVCIDYSSINIAKRFHIGHLSTTMIGTASSAFMITLATPRWASTTWATGERSSAS